MVIASLYRSQAGIIKGIAIPLPDGRLCRVVDVVVTIDDYFAISSIAEWSIWMTTLCLDDPIN